MHSPQQPPQRPWWQRSASSSKLNGESSGRGKKLTSLASTLGLKNRKSGNLRPPNSPPSPVLPLHTGLMEPPSPRARPSMPSSSSRPTTQASWDEPRTPSDAAKHASLTQSVLTTSEMDPFAAQYIPSSASMLESHALSVFDDADEHDDRVPGHKADFTLAYNRQSYTSSSEADHTNSLTAPLRTRAYHPHMPDVPDDVGTSPPLLSPAFPDDDWRHSRATTASDKVIRHEHFLPLDAMMNEPPVPQIRPSASASTLRKGRPRGLTDVNRVNPMPPSPTVVIRQPSLPRMIPAPQAPPRSNLPPTPAVPSQHLREPSPGDSSSSSGISFASSSGLHPPPGQLAKALKKAVSSHSLSKRGSGSSTTPTSPPYEPDHPDHPGKAVKKQRSFHHARIPLPPLPSALRHTASTGSDVMPTLARNPSASSNSPSVLSQTMGSPQLGAARRRLFSGSSRRSNSSAQRERDDTDVRSLFSLNGAPPDEVRRPGRDSELSIATHTTGAGSFWDDGEPPASPGGERERERDYAPQHIMAPADMLRLEEALGADATGSQAAKFMRERGRSFNSVRTSHSGTFSDAAVSTESDVHFPGSPQSTLGSPYGSPYTGTSSPRVGVGSPTFGTPPQGFGSPHTGYTSPTGLSPHSPLAPSPVLSRSSTRNSRDIGPPPVRRADSLLQRTLGVPTTRPRRPSTANDALDSPIALSRGPSNASSMMSARSNGLPPPPRRARVPSAGAASAPVSRRTSTVPIQPLSPPPKWRTPPGPRSRAPSDASSRPPPVAGSGVHKSIARRPSFLEIAATEEDEGAEGEDEHDNIVQRGSPEEEDYGVELQSARRRPADLSIATPPASVRSMRVPHSAGAGPPPQSAFMTGPPSLAREPPVVAVARQPRGSIDDSFLDMGKSSFETVRSDDEDYGR
ncbi:unnamed protein product [Peniophora sp. CBMAI 1063]|nr:unnamed protein product [Peniophora sp. CBMAI 1063]